MASDRYVLLERIGIGGMAEVFRAAVRGAEGFERPVAVKRILPHLSDDVDFVRMFIDEAKIAVQLQHPNIVQILDLGREGHEYFIVMEYVHGKDLRTIQDRVAQLGDRIPLAIVVHIALKICEALHHAHFATGPGGRPLNVVHRDVTPQNVLVSFDGEVKVTDFGLAKAAGRVTQTQAGVIKGKLAYMAPEAFLGWTVDHRSDVYGVGILLWEMLTGKRLFLGKNDLETVTKAQAAVVPPLRSIDPTIPEELDRIVLRALARDRDQRYQTAEELHDDLEVFGYGSGHFITTAGLATWIRELFPAAFAPPAETKRRAPDVVTREIRLAKDPTDEDAYGAGSGARPTHRPMGSAPRPATWPPEEVELLEDEPPVLEPGAPDEVDEVTALFGSEPPAEEGHDTQRPPPRGSSDEETRVPPAEYPTEQHYDGDLTSTTIPHAPPAPREGVAAVQVSGLAWDEEEEMTQVDHPKRH